MQRVASPEHSSDWKASEVAQTDDENTDNYRSDKALGHLYRKVKDELLQIPEEDLKPSSSRYSPLTDPISKRLIPLLDKHFEPGFASNARQRPLKEFEEIQKTFDYYSRELEYICFTHTLSNKPGDRLMEAEVVMSTILANHSQKRLRKERVERMKTHTEALVHDVEKRLFPGGNRDAIGEEQYMVGLGRGWIAWYLSQVHAEQEGANSFGLMALGIVLDCVAGLGPTSAI
ncbi:hypothetical protein D9611_004926 [Ephemerocybe angulata]|uniref:Uncharacterized protein n=1 Tax=Ephemerocybe angulata TaxID=980116 RepID=A0A8H5EXF8_9AGAR|nr:hypothetical protein D9611_004926 [Tulosesus angulatus]